MNDDGTQKQLFERSLAFFGTITASLSHEMNNVLAIVNELNGLQEDCLIAAKRGRELDPDKLRGTVNSISAQIERGRSLVKQQNVFAHCVDQLESTLDAPAILGAVVALCERFARLRKIEIRYRPPAEPVEIRGCAFDLQHLVYRSLELALASTPAGETVSIDLQRDAAGALVQVRTSGGQEPDMDAKTAATFLVALTRELGVTADLSMTAGEPLAIGLHLPPSIARRCR